jgi:hypothetical protein
MRSSSRKSRSGQRTSRRCCQCGAIRASIEYALDVFNPLSRTSVYDLTPLRETLATVCDFDQVNDSSHHSDIGHRHECCGWRSSLLFQSPGDPRCALARYTEGSQEPTNSRAYPRKRPGFPMTDIGDMPCWDGGLFDNTRSGLCSMCWMGPKLTIFRSSLSNCSQRATQSRRMRRRS